MKDLIKVIVRHKEKASDKTNSDKVFISLDDAFQLEISVVARHYNFTL